MCGIPSKRAPICLVASAPFKKKRSTVAVIFSNKVELMYITKLYYYYIYIYMYYKEHCFNPPLEILTEFQPPENPLQKKKGGTFATPGNALRSRGASGGKTASNRCWIHWASSIHWDKARWWSVMIPDSPALKSHLSNHPCSRIYIYFFRVRVSWIFLRRCNKKITKRRICKKNKRNLKPREGISAVLFLMPLRSSHSHVRHCQIFSSTLGGRRAISVFLCINTCTWRFPTHL